MEECQQSLDSPEDFQQLQQEFNSGSPEPEDEEALLDRRADDQDGDDEDEVEALRNSLREAVEDPSMKPSVQCLLVDPSFSMVTVQSEDSGIVWETASSPSRCSTPGWASETCSLASESCSGAGDAGRITIIFDQDKVVRRRTRSGSRSISSRLSDRFRRTSGGSASRCGSALGVERLEMAETSVPNVRASANGAATRGGGGGAAEEAEPPDKDQQLFSLISDGYEILNIRVPSKLPTVDEEESSDLPENLSYLEQNPGIRTRSAQPTQNHSAPAGLEEMEPPQDQEDQPSSATQRTLTDSGGDMDYFEKFSLLDNVVPAETEGGEEEQLYAQAEEQRPRPGKEAPGSAAESPAVSSDGSFVFVTDADVSGGETPHPAPPPGGDPLDHLAGDHLDEVFYGNGGLDSHAVLPQDTEEEMEEMRRRSRRESQRSAKGSGSRLFGSEETVLKPIYLPEGPPKIIDQILLDEPPAMSFMYTDLYEEAMGERSRSEENLEAHSVTPERGFRRRTLSEAEEEEESDGSYLEMFTLRDELPPLDKLPDAQEEKRANSMMLPPSMFEMTGCLQRVEEEEEEEEEAETKEEEEPAEEFVPLAAASEESDGTSSQPPPHAGEQEVKREAEARIEGDSDAAGVAADETCAEDAAAEASPASAEEPSRTTLVEPDEGLEEGASDVAKDAEEETGVTEAPSEPEPVAEDENAEKLTETTEPVPTQEELKEVEVPTQEATIQEELICTADSTEAETSTKAPPVAEEREEAVVVAETLPPPVEAVADLSGPAIQAVVEVAESAAEQTEVQTIEVQIYPLTTEVAEELPPPAAQATEVSEGERRQEPAVTEDEGTSVESHGADVSPGPDSDAKPEPELPEEVKAADADEAPSLVPESPTGKDGERTEPCDETEGQSSETGSENKQEAEAEEKEAVPLPAGSEESDRTPGREQVIREEAEEVKRDETEERKVQEKEENKEEEEVISCTMKEEAPAVSSQRQKETDKATKEETASEATNADQKTLLTTGEGSEETQGAAGALGGAKTPPEVTQEATDRGSPERAPSAYEVLSEEPATAPEPKTATAAAERPMETQRTEEVAVPTLAVTEPEAVITSQVVVGSTEEPEAGITSQVIVGSTEEPETSTVETLPWVDTETETTVVVAETLPPPVEVVTDDSQPAIKAVVEVTEGATDQTQVQVDLREEEAVIAEEEEETQKPEPEEAGSGVADSEPLLPEMEVKQADVVETPSSPHHDVPESTQSTTTGKRADERSVPADASDAANREISVLLPTETVSVGDEMIVLVPRGTAVEMDIEVRRSSDVPVPKGTATEMDVEVEGQISDVPVPKGTDAEMDVEVEGQISDVPVPKGTAAEMDGDEVGGHSSEVLVPKETVVEMDVQVDGQGSDVPVPKSSDILVPKGTVVEMDVDVGQSSDAPPARPEPQDPPSLDTVSPPPPPQAPDTTNTSATEPKPHIQPPPEESCSVAEMATEVVERWPSPPPAPAEEEEEEVEEMGDVEEEEEEQGAFLRPLRSFTAQEDLSALISELSGTEEEREDETLVTDVPQTDGEETELRKTPALPPPRTEGADATGEREKDDAVGLGAVAEEVSGTEDVVAPETETCLVAEEMELREADTSPAVKPHTEDTGPETELHTDHVEVDRPQIMDEGPATELREGDLGPATELREGDLGPETELREGDLRPETELREGDISEAPQMVPEEPGYEIISQQEVKEESSKETEATTALADQEPIPEEEDYDIIDAEEESQAREAAALHGMDWFCVDCGCLLLDQERQSGPHMEHQVTAVETAYHNIKERLGEWISELQARSENIEDLVSELEMSYNAVEDQCGASEEAMQHQNEEMMALVMEQYNGMSLSMETEKKSKLEQLYDQIVSFQESIDAAKLTLETTAREEETDARSIEDIEASLSAALQSAMSLELGPRGLLVFEDYTKKSSSSSTTAAPSHSLPVPQKPLLSEQEAGSATGTSVTVYWRVEPGDVIDCFQVYCMEHPQGAVSEEYRVTVKESFCVLEELEPEKSYKVWVMAVNSTGCSLPSDRRLFRTAPSVPVIQTERCSVLGDWATLRWTPTTSTTTTTTEEKVSYTLEYCRQYELEGEGLRSISGIRATEQVVLLQPDEKYLFYIKAVNQSGASEQSEAALISTKSSRFHLLETSCHCALVLSDDLSTVTLSQDATHTQCPSVLGECLPARGCHYWETSVVGSPAYRVGVAYETANKESPLGEDSASWCLHCVATPSSCRMELRHAGSVCCAATVGDAPQRLGVLLDYPECSLSFYNAQSGQRLAAVRQRFTRPCHPVLGLDAPGTLALCMVPELPTFTKTS